MPTDQHHRSKKVRYDLVLVPRDDAGQAKSVRFAPWQALTLVAGSLILIVIAVLALLAYTPIGALIPIENAELVNRYSKDLVSLNQRMTSLMEQLVELRGYNVKLRKALGEQVVATDSGVAVVGSPRSANIENRKEAGQLERAIGAAGVQIPRSSLGMATVQLLAQEQHQVVFPVVLPAEGYISRGFDTDQRHYGLDIAGKMGTLVNAAADGYVVFAGWTSDDGYKLILSHSGGFLTFYQHNQSLLKSAHAFVRRGEPIALLGNSGQTSVGPHVHFEIWKDGVPVDPANYILNLNF
jgi:murein DD-endopeptidase MepM/ murein hydrolase activator NlpD